MRKEQLIQFLGESTLHIVEAMEKIDANAHGILFIADKSGRLQGTVTDGDIRRSIRSPDYNPARKTEFLKSPLPH